MSRRRRRRRRGFSASCIAGTRPWEAAGPPGADDYAGQARLIRELCAFAEITPGADMKSKARHGDRILRSIVVEGGSPPAVRR